LKQSIKITEESLGLDNPELADILMDFGILNKLKNDDSTSQQAFKRGLEIVKVSFGATHPKVESFENHIHN